MNFEFPLVIFTVLSQLGLGLALVGAWKALRGEVPGRTYWLWTVAATAAGLVFSLFHLGHPLGAVTTLSGLGVSWLSREILSFGIFGAMTLALCLRQSRPLALLAGVMALIAVGVQSMTYAPVSLPAIHSVFTPLFFLLTALALGTSFARDTGQIQRMVLVLLIAILLLAPGMWSTGSGIMRDTAALWLTSPFFWGGLVLMATVLGMSIVRRGLPKISGALMLAGALLVRMTFFGASVHTATRLGMPY